MLKRKILFSILYVTLFSVLSSCSEKKSMNHLLTNGKEKIWKESKLNKYYNTRSREYIFYSDGRYLERLNSQLGRNLAEGTPAYFPTWRIDGDSFLIMNGIRRKILLFSNDSLFLINEINGNRISLVRGTVP